MNPNRDEIRRQLRQADAEQRAALPRFGAALRRAFDPTSTTSRTERAELVGFTADRRGFLRIGGMTVAASAILVACGSGPGEDVAQTGGTLAEELTPLEPEIGRELDVDLLLTATSLEALAVAAYGTVLDEGLLTDSTLTSVATLFRDQHTEHQDVLAQTTRDLGETPYTDPNPYLSVNVLEPAVAGLASLEGDELTTAVLDLAYLLENTAAQTYAWATSLLSEAELRQAAMSIGGVEARHISVLLGALEQPQVPFGLMKVGAHVPEDSFITPDGPVKEPTTTTTGAPAEGEDDSTTTTEG